jgi:hypothetical protein
VGIGNEIVLFKLAATAAAAVTLEPMVERVGVEVGNRRECGYSARSKGARLLVGCREGTTGNMGVCNQQISKLKGKRRLTV